MTALVLFIGAQLSRVIPNVPSAGRSPAYGDRTPNDLGDTDGGATDGQSFPSLGDDRRGGNPSTTSTTHHDWHDVHDYDDDYVAPPVV
jgi:hypothetical protein